MIFILSLLVIFVCSVSAQCNKPSSGNTVPGDNTCIHYSGRVALSAGTASFDWSGVGFTFFFEGTSLSLVFSGGNQNEYNVSIDGNDHPLVVIKSGNMMTYPVATGLTNAVHKAIISKRTEANFGAQVLHSIVLDTNKWLQPTPPIPTRRLEFIGDSITCGYGDEGTYPCSFSAQTENNLLAYSGVIGDYFAAEVFVECWSGKGLVRNYGDKNPTSPDPLPSYYNKTLASESNSPAWSFGWIPNGVVINLGTNDYSTQPAPSTDVFNSAYKAFITQIKNHYGSKVHLFLVCGPMIGNPCCQNVKQVAADNQPNVHYVDLEGILTQSDLGCDYHPNVAGHKKMADLTIPTIASALNWNN